jgi:hypothetical protein
MKLKMHGNMKRIRLRFKRSHFIAFLILAGVMAHGQTFERSRALSRSFALPASAEIQVSNKYGDIHLIPWEKDSVRFEIDFRVTSTKQSKVDKIFDNVDFDFKSTNYYVIAQTLFLGQNTFWTEITDAASSVFSSGTHTQIDYTIYFPESNAVKIDNKYGNIYTTDHTGKADFSLSNGDLKAHAFLGETKIRLDFAYATIEEIKRGKLEINYSQFNLEKSDELDIESKSSKVYITNVNILFLNSRRDKYYVHEAGLVEGESFFSNLNLDIVKEKLNLRTSYGDIKLQSVPENFRQMDLSAQSTDITLYLDEKHLYEIEVTKDDHTQMIYTSRLITKTETLVNEKDQIYKVECRAGVQDGQKVPVRIDARGGKIYLMGR